MSTAWPTTSSPPATTSSSTRPTPSPRRSPATPSPPAPGSGCRSCASSGRGGRRHPLAGEFTWVDDVEAARVAAEGSGSGPSSRPGASSSTPSPPGTTATSWPASSTRPTGTCPRAGRSCGPAGPTRMPPSATSSRAGPSTCSSTKDSGGALTEAKLAAAHDLGVPVVVVRRPPVPDGVPVVESVGDALRAMDGRGGRGASGRRRETGLTAYALAYVRERDGGPAAAGTVGAAAPRGRRAAPLRPGVAARRRARRHHGRRLPRARRCSRTPRWPGCPPSPGSGRSVRGCSSTRCSGRRGSCRSGPSRRRR